MELTESELTEYLSSIDGKQPQLFQIKGSGGLKALISSYGPRLISLSFPDAGGVERDLVLNYPRLADYEADASYQGQMAVGPYANRISNADYVQPDDTNPMSEEGALWKLPVNDGKNTLHSAEDNWARKVWQVVERSCDAKEARLVFELPAISKIKMGRCVPARKVRLAVTLTADNSLILKYSAQTDYTTPMNPTFHPYFNLNGTENGPVTNHQVFTTADRLLDVDDNLIPTGALNNVSGTSFDFSGKPVLSQVFGEKGFDHCFVFPGEGPKSFKIWSPVSRIQMEFTTDQPSFQFYTGFFLPRPFRQFGGFCVEAQRLVDGINHPEWEQEFGPSFLTPGQTFVHKTRYQFRVTEDF